MKNNSDVPIIAVTTELVNEMSDEMIEAGFTSVITKPLQKDVVLKLLQSLDKDSTPVFDYVKYVTTYKDVSLQQDIVQTFIDEEKSVV